jgi:hypothetical protein
VFGPRHTEKTSTGLEWSLQVAFCGFAQDVDSDRLGLDEVLECHETLDEKGLGVFHVSMEEDHHKHSHVDASDQLGSFCQVIVSNGSSDKSTRLWSL